MQANQAECFPECMLCSLLVRTSIPSVASGSRNQPFAKVLVSPRLLKHECQFSAGCKDTGLFLCEWWVDVPAFVERGPGFSGCQMEITKDSS